MAPTIDISKSEITLNKENEDAPTDVEVGKDADVEKSKKGPSEASTNNIITKNIDIHIPTRMDIFYDLNGSLGFAIGSSGFILAMYYENWLPHFRYGSLAWIWGCVLYTIPLLFKLKGFSRQNGNDQDRRCNSPWDLGDLGEFLCYVFYIIGCILGGFFNEEKVEEFLPAINHMFVYGSFSLALKPTYQLIVYLYGKVGKATKSSASASSTISTDIDSDSNNVYDEGNLQRWDHFFELSAMIFFCAAGVFGGFPPHPSLALPGVYFWEVGSLFSVARSLLMMYRRDKGLKYLQNKNLSKN